MERTEFVHFYITQDNRKWCWYEYAPPDAVIEHPTHITKEELEILLHWTIKRAMEVIDNHI